MYFLERERQQLCFWREVALKLPSCLCVHRSPALEVKRVGGVSDGTSGHRLPSPHNLCILCLIQLCNMRYHLLGVIDVLLDITFLNRVIIKINLNAYNGQIHPKAISSDFEFLCSVTKGLRGHI